MSNNCTVADIGSGTGIFTKQLLEKGSKVLAVEPNDDMRKYAEDNLSHYANFISVKGTAENTTLETKSVDFITVAQAFHWFDTISFRNECLRILKPNGKVVLIWNSRIKTSEFVKENALIYKKYCPNFYSISGNNDEDDFSIDLFFNSKYETRRFSNEIMLSKTRFIEECLSKSYALNEKDADYNNYITALNDLFDKYAINGAILEPYETKSHFGKL